MDEDREIMARNPLFLAVTRPALFAGIPIEAAVVILLSSVIVLIGFNNPVYAAVILQGKQQIEQAQSLYRDLNKATDISNVANQLKSDMLRTSDVSSSSLDGYTSGNVDVVGGLRGKANDVYQDLIGRSSQAATESERAAYEQGAREAAVSTGLASNVGDAVTSRREGLDELRGRLGNATSAAERADMSARLQLEQAQMMNDQMALQAVELQRRAKAEADYQRHIAFQQSETAKLRSEVEISR